MENNEIPASRLRRLRKEKRMSQAALGSVSGYTQSTIGMIEQGIRGYGSSVINIAKALGTTPDYLLCETHINQTVAPSEQPHPSFESENLMKLFEELPQNRILRAKAYAAACTALFVYFPQTQN